MAIWQYQLFVIPREALMKHFKSIPDSLAIHKDTFKKMWDSFLQHDQDSDCESFDARNYNWWQHASIKSKNLINQIDELLPRDTLINSSDSVSWKGDSKNYNDHDAFLAFDLKSGNVIDFGFRIDLRDNNSSSIISLLKICQDKDFLVMDSKGNLFEPRLDLLSDSIKKSRAAHYLNDPEDFFRKLVNDEN